MTSRYDTLNVSVNSPNPNNQKLNRTIEVSENVRESQDS